MTDIDDPALTELVELCSFLLDNVERIPAHRRRQAVLALERAERLVTIHDVGADDLDVDGQPAPATPTPRKGTP